MVIKPAEQTAGQRIGEEKPEKKRGWRRWFS